MGEAIGNACRQETEFVSNVKTLAVEAFCEDALRLVESVDGISQLDLTAITAIFDECVRS